MLFIVCRLISGLSIVSTLVDPKKYIRTLGDVVRQKRIKLGYSQESFAAEIGLHRTYMGQIERGEKNLTMKNLLRIADAFDTKTSTLLREVENNLKR